MQRFRRKQVEVEAWQVPQTVFKLTVAINEVQEETAFPGDWIVQDIDTGEITIFSDGEFELAFEKIRQL